MKLSQLAPALAQVSKELSTSRTADAHLAPSPRMQGAIRRLKEGYGFIACDDGRDYFFHWTGMEQTGPSFKDLALLARVEFNLTTAGPKGVRAICIRVLPSL